MRNSRLQIIIALIIFICLSVVVIYVYINQGKSTSDDESVSVSSSTATLSVNANQVVEPFSGRQNGFLVSLIDDDDPEYLYLDLKSKLYRTNDNILIDDLEGTPPHGQYQLAKKSGATVQAVMYEVYFNKYRDQGIWPGDNGDWSGWEDNVREVMDALMNKGYDVEWEIWNEPNADYFWPRSEEQYQQTWIRAYNIIRTKDPDGKIVGPSYNIADMTKIKSFLTFAKANNVLPDVVTWHEIYGPDECAFVVERVAEIQQFMKQNGIDAEIDINEFTSYIDPYEAGLLANSLSYLEKSGTRSAAHACWEIDGVNDCWGFTMDGILTPEKEPRSLWWVYKYYAQMGGNIVDSTTDDATVQVLPTVDTGQNKISLLIGNDSTADKQLTVKIEHGSFADSISESKIKSFLVMNSIKDVHPQPNSANHTIGGVEGQTLNLSFGNIPGGAAIYIEIDTSEESKFSGGDIVPNIRVHNEEVECGAMDANDDGKFTIVDFVAFAKVYQGTCKETEDVSGNAGVNTQDPVCGMQDVNGDGKITLIDFSSFVKRYGKDSCAIE